MKTDADLAAAFRAGDESAFSQLYDRYKRGLFAFARRMLGDKEAAADLVQTAFLHALERRRQLVRPERFRSWLFAIARNLCLSDLRHRPTPLDDFVEELPDPGGGPDTDLEWEDDIRLVRQALRRMAPDHREVLILREYQDLSYDEIAEVTGSTVSAVKSRLFKARRELHALLKSAFATRS
jgi:RNA polymerase sigma-70 factor, ECF subfamily